MPSPTVYDQETVIAGEQEYLFRGQGHRLQDVSWVTAACRTAEPELFFPISTHETASRARALRYCGSCTLRQECLQVALADPSLVGIWGGTDEVERAALRRRHLVAVLDRPRRGGSAAGPTHSRTHSGHGQRRRRNARTRCRRARQVIKYLGSKRALVRVLGDMAVAVGATTALDLFTGTTRVAQELKRRSVHTTAVDVATYSEVLAQCYLSTDATEVDRASWPTSRPPAAAARPSPATSPTTFCQESRFFQPKNGARVDAIRERIASD